MSDDIPPQMKMLKPVQQQNYRLRTDSSHLKYKFTGQILALDSAVVQTKTVKLAWMFPNLCYTSSQKNDRFKLTLMKQKGLLTH